MENSYNDIPTPLIDLAPFSSRDCKESEFLRIGKEIVKCFENPGYVYLTNVGVHSDEIKDFVKAFDKFNELDYEIQNKYYKDTETYHGFSTDYTEILNSYTPLGKRTTRSMFDIQSLDEPFPDDVPELKEAAVPIAEKLALVTLNIIKAIERGLDFPNGFLVDKHQNMFGLENFSDLRVTNYCPPSKDDQTIRCEAHCDICTVTLQLYGDLEGLQLLDCHGNWQTAKLYEGYSLLFPAEQLQMMTGNKTKAVKHQVVNPSDIRDIGKPRHAVLFFVHPDHDVDIRPYNHSDDIPLITSKDYSSRKGEIYFNKRPLPATNKLEILARE